MDARFHRANGAAAGIGMGGTGIAAGGTGRAGRCATAAISAADARAAAVPTIVPKCTSAGDTVGGAPAAVALPAAAPLYLQEKHQPLDSQHESGRLATHHLERRG